MTTTRQIILDKLYYVARYIGDQTTDWFRVKRELLCVLPPKARSFLSKRHKTSKKHFINDLELELIKSWKEITGIQLQVDDSRLHKSSDERPPRYWGLMEYNKKRQAAKKNAKK
jgi:hypothetical protein